MALVVKNLPANEGDLRDQGSIPGRGRFPGEGNGNPLQHSCLENPMDRGSWLVQSLSRVRLFMPPWMAAGQASLSINNSQSLL